MNFTEKVREYILIHFFAPLKTYEPAMRECLTLAVQPFNLGCYFTASRPPCAPALTHITKHSASNRFFNFLSRRKGMTK